MGTNTAFRISRMEWIGLLGVVCATTAVALGWSGRNSLSVLVGGVMGLANLRLWRGIVHGLIARQTATAAGLVVRFFLKLVLLAGFVWAVLRSSLTPWGVVVGFGSVLVGLLWASCFPSCKEE